MKKIINFLVKSKILNSQVGWTTFKMDITFLNNKFYSISDMI
jgi:hypothetical protein